MADRVGKSAGALFLVLALVIGTAVPAPAIVVGEPAPNEDFAGAMVVGFVEERYPGGVVWFPVCSGALIDDASGAFLTAAHCIDVVENLIEPDMVGVSFADELDGDRDRVADPALVHEVSSMHAHPQFAEAGGGAKDSHDVGILIVEDVASVPTVDLAPVGTADGHRGPRSSSIVTVGYGLSRLDPPFQKTPAHFRPGMPRMRASSGITNVQRHYVRVQQNTAAGFDGGCAGDSGGASLMDGRLVAIESFGDPMCVAWGAKYRIDTTDVQAWIASVLAAH